MQENKIFYPQHKGISKQRVLELVLDTFNEKFGIAWNDDCIDINHPALTDEWCQYIANIYDNLWVGEDEMDKDFAEEIIDRFVNKLKL